MFSGVGLKCVFPVFLIGCDFSLSLVVHSSLKYENNE